MLSTFSNRVPEVRLAILALFAAIVFDAPPDMVALELWNYHTHRVDVAHRHGETEDARIERMHDISIGVEHACRAEPLEAKLGWRHNDCVALAVTMAEWESGLMVEVQSGEKRGPSGEVGLWQFHRLATTVPDPKYRVTSEDLTAMVGLSLEATARQALGGVRTIGWQIHRCKLRKADAWAAATVFAEYHLPRWPCPVPYGDEMSAHRAAHYRNLVGRLNHPR